MNNRENGSIVVLVALSLTVLIGLSVFVTDLGVMYVKHARLQNAMDAAVLAGAQELATSTTLAQQVAEEYAYDNGVSQVSVDFSPDNKEISASAQEVFPSLFSRIWGIEENAISASATAKIVPPESIVGGLIPLSLKKADFDTNYTPGVQYTIKFGGGNFINPGWFGCLDFPGGSGANSLYDFITNGYPGSIGLGDIIHEKTGVNCIKVKDAIQNRLDSDTNNPKYTYLTYKADAPEIVYVPIVEIDPNEAQKVDVIGFAAFFVETAGGNGQEAEVTGRFITTIVIKGESKGSSPDSDYGLYGVRLIS